MKVYYSENYNNNAGLDAGQQQYRKDVDVSNNSGDWYPEPLATRFVHW